MLKIPYRMPIDGLMWWFAGVVALLLFLFWPTQRRRCLTHLAAAQRAFSRRDWPEYEKQFTLATRAAGSLKGHVQAHCLGQLELLQAEADYWRGRASECAAHLEKAIEYTERAGAPDRCMALASAHRLWGELHLDEEALDQAEAHIRDALQFDQTGGNEALMIFDLQRLGDVLLERGHQTEAKAVIERCAALERKVIHQGIQEKGKDPGQSAVISMSMPDLCLASGDYARAEKLFQEKVDYWSRLVTRPDNIDVTRYQFHLARAQRKQGRLLESVATLRQACETAERDYGSHHPRTARALRKLAVTLLAAGEHDEAKATAQRADCIRAS